MSAPKSFQYVVRKKWTFLHDVKTQDCNVDEQALVIYSMPEKRNQTVTFSWQAFNTEPALQV